MRHTTMLLLLLLLLFILFVLAEVSSSFRSDYGQSGSATEGNLLGGYAYIIECFPFAVMSVIYSVIAS